VYTAVVSVNASATLISSTSLPARHVHVHVDSRALNDTEPASNPKVLPRSPAPDPAGTRTSPSRSNSLGSSGSKSLPKCPAQCCKAGGPKPPSRSNTLPVGVGNGSGGMKSRAKRFLDVLRRAVTCPTCRGLGLAVISVPTGNHCATCRGTGEEIVTYSCPHTVGRTCECDGSGGIDFATGRNCRDCRGSGQEYENQPVPCSTCQGEGQISDRLARILAAQRGGGR
jgi:hypothetical protein